MANTLPVARRFWPCCLFLVCDGVGKRTSTIIPAHNFVTTQTTQHHSFGEVYECLYKGELTALKLFRNTSDEDAIKEIEVMFALRHPNIIGLYAWVVQSGQINQYGYV